MSEAPSNKVVQDPNDTVGKLRGEDSTILKASADEPSKYIMDQDSSLQGNAQINKIAPQPHNYSMKFKNDAEVNIYRKMTKHISQQFKNEDRTPDQILLDRMNKHFQGTFGKVEEILFYQKRDFQSLSVEYVTVGQPGDENYDELLFYITEMHNLCCVSLINKQEHPGLEDEPHKLIKKFENNIYCFKVFSQGKYILVGGETSNGEKPLQLLVKNGDSYTVDTDRTSKIPVKGHVVNMQVSTKQQKIFISDNVKHLIYSGQNVKHQFFEIEYTIDMKLTKRNLYESDSEIYFFIFDEYMNKKDEHNNFVYVSDFSGQILRLDSNYSLKAESMNTNHQEKQTMGFLDIDEHYLYCAEYGTSFISIYEKETKEKRIIQVDAMAHYLKIYKEYLILTDMSYLYVLEKETFKIIAGYDTKGDVTAICPRGETDNVIYGYTTTGQLFKVSLELQESNVRIFCKKDRIVSMSSSGRQRGQISAILNKKLGTKKYDKKNENGFLCCGQKQKQERKSKTLERQITIQNNTQYVYIYDEDGNLYQMWFENLEYKVRKIQDNLVDFKPHYVIMKNIGETVYLVLDSSIIIYTPENTWEIQHTSQNKQEKAFIKQMKIVQDFKWQKNNRTIFYQHCLLIVTIDDELKTFDGSKEGNIAIISILGKDYFQQGILAVDLLQNYHEDPLDENKKQYIIVAYQEQGDQKSSKIELFEFPSLDQEKDQSYFAITPKLISCMKVSSDQQYLAVGCEDGYLIVYKISWNNQPHEIHEIYHPHSFMVTDLLFIKRGKRNRNSGQLLDDEETSDEEDDYRIENVDYLIASISVDRRLVISSLKQRLRVFEYDIKRYLLELVYHSPTNKIFVRTYDHQIYEVDMNVKLFKEDQYNHSCSVKVSLKDDIKEVQHADHSEFALEIMRQFLHSEDQNQQVACMRFIKDTSLIFRKMNLATISASFGSRQGLEVAFDQGQSLMNTLDGISILEITQKSNVFNSIIYNKILNDEYFLFDSQEDDFFTVLLTLQNNSVREVINNLFMDSKFADKSSNLAKGRIRNNYIFETDHRLITKNDRKKYIITDEELDKIKKNFDRKNFVQEIVVFKTLRVPLVLQRGNPKFIKLLSSMSQMPDENREQLPIQILIKYLQDRDGLQVRLMHYPYVLMAVLITFYMLNSATMLDHDKWYDGPFKYLISICAVYFLIIRIFEITPFILEKYQISKIKQLTICLDIILSTCTLIFFGHQTTHDKLMRSELLDGSENTLQWTMNIMIGIVFYKLLEVCRLYRPTRAMSQYFIYVIAGLGPFMLILFIILFCFTMLEFLNQPITPREGAKFKEFGYSFMDQYQLIFGENPDHTEMTPFQKAFYIGFTLFINVINLNLLISIIGFQLDEFLLQQVARDMQTQIDIFMTYNCTIDTFRRSVACCFRHKHFKKSPMRQRLDNQPKYIHYMTTDIDDKDVKEQSEQFEGRVKAMMKKQDYIQSELTGLKHLIIKKHSLLEVDLFKLQMQVRMLQNKNGQFFR